MRRSQDLKQMTLLKRARSAWHAMRKRCLNPRSHAWSRYGGAGIAICPQWATFEQFQRDMGLPPTPSHWLGRKDVLGHYTPSNCIWTEPAQQQRRRAFCHRVHLQDGRVLTAAEVARLPGMPGFHGVRNRLNRGFSLELPQPKKLYLSSIWITWQGKTMPAPEWAKHLGITPSAFWARLRRWMPLEKAMSGPMRIHRKKRSVNKTEHDE
jgi:hypothetical protein